MSNRVMIVGATGKLGRVLLEELMRDSELSLGPVVTHAVNQMIGVDAGLLVGANGIGQLIVDDVVPHSGLCEIIVDCTNSRAFDSRVNEYAAIRKPLIVATTSLSADGVECLKSIAQRVPVVLAENFSEDFWKFVEAVDSVQRSVGHHSGIDIVEIHGVNKKDSPSASSKTLRNRLLSSGFDREISIASIRRAHTAGEHHVHFSTDSGVEIQLSIRTSDRRSYAIGILNAAKVITALMPGLYSFPDVLTERQNAH